MLIEAVNAPVTCRWADGELTLKPGEPTYLPDERGKKLLAKAGARVRQVQPTDWLTRWRELAQVTGGLLPDDPRVNPVLSVLADCDRAHRLGDLHGFQRAAARVHRLMQFAPGSTVCWDGTVNHRLTLLGPAPVEFVHFADGRLQVCVVWQGNWRLVSEAIVKEIRDPK